MDRAQLEAFIWRHWPTRGSEARYAVDAVLDAADAYAMGKLLAARTRRRRRLRVLQPQPKTVLCHTSDTDLYPLIGTLAAALLGGEQEAAA